jgi:hypothetical protein
MFPLDMRYSHRLVYEFVQCALDFWDDVVLLDVLLTKDLVEVLNQFHGNELMRQLIIILVDETAEAEVQFEGGTVFGSDKTTVR